MEIIEDSKKFKDEELGQLREITGDICEELDIKNDKIITKSFIFSILLALVISIPIPNFFDFLNENIKNNPESWLKNAYDDYLNLKKDDFSAKSLKKRVSARSNYYEKAFKIRAKIQNTEWTYHNLDKDVTKFIQGRETTKLMVNKVSLMNNKKTYYPCPVCSTKYLDSETDNCPRCEKDNDISMFIKICNTFYILGDMEIFYNNLDEKTGNILLDNWKYIGDFFNKKRIKKNHDIWCKNRKEYGLQQYNKIIKPEGGDWGLQEPEIKEFNKKYDMALVKGILTIDLKNCKNGALPEFTKELSSIHFPFCEELILPPRKININDLKPDMPFLIRLKANNCGIKNIDLDPQYFPQLKYIHLENNEITKYDDIKNLKKIKNLKIIELYGNPIEKTKEIYIAENNFRYNIELRYDINRKYNPNKKIEMESDSEVIKLKQNLNWESSDSEDSEIFLRKKRYERIEFKRK